MSKRQEAREQYVNLFRTYNNSGQYIDYQRAHYFLEGFRMGVGDICFDFCVAGDEAAMADGFDNACWGIAAYPRVGAAT